MEKRTHQALILGATAFLGAAAVIGTAIRVVEHVNHWLRWQMADEPMPVVIDTQSNGGVTTAWTGTSSTR